MKELCSEVSTLKARSVTLQLRKNQTRGKQRQKPVATKIGLLSLLTEETLDDGLPRQGSTLEATTQTRGKIVYRERAFSTSTIRDRRLEEKYCMSSLAAIGITRSKAMTKLTRLLSSTIKIRIWTMRVKSDLYRVETRADLAASAKSLKLTLLKNISLVTHWQTLTDLYIEHQ